MSAVTIKKTQRAASAGSRRSAAANRPIAIAFGDLGLIRSLGEARIPVIAAGTRPDRSAYASRYAQKRLLLPPYESHRFVDELLRIGPRFEQKPVLFTDNDKAVLAFSRHRAALSDYYQFLLPDDTLIEDLADKRRFARLAEEQSLPVPRTFFPATQEEFQEAARLTNYPCILKPAHQDLWKDERLVSGLLGGRYKKAFKAHNRQGLLDAYEQIRRFSPELVVQEYVPGGDDHLYCLNIYLDAQGAIKGLFLGQKLRCCPVEFGMGSFVESVIDQPLINLGIQIAQRLGYRGLANLEFKKDRDSQQFKLLEINPRFNSWGYLGTYCGVNLPARLYHDRTGQPTAEESRPRYATGVRWLHLKNDLKALVEYRQRGEWPLRRWLRSFSGPLTFHQFSWRDPLPALAGCWLFIRGHLFHRPPRGA